MAHLSPLQLLNLYLTDGKSLGPKESKLYQKFNKDISWDAILNKGYQSDLAPLLYYIITKTEVLQKAMSNEQRAMSNSQRTELKAQSAMSNQQRAMSN